MSSPSTFKKSPLSQVEDKRVNFQNPKQIIFPKVCVICCETAEHQYKKTIFGSFESNKDYKENYTLDIPICSECSTYIKMNTGLSSKSGKLLLVSSLVGFILGIYLYFVLFSLFLSISLIATSIVLPYLNYKAKMKNRIKFDDYLKIGLGADSTSLTFVFFNANYAKYISEINPKRESEENPPGIE